MICYNHHGSNLSPLSAWNPSPQTRLEIVLKEHGGAVDECIVVSLGTLGNHRKTIEKNRGAPPLGTLLPLRNPLGNNLYSLT